MLFLILLLAATCDGAGNSTSGHFAAFFPQFEERLLAALHDNCTRQYARFLVDHSHETAASELESCLLDSEYVSSATLVNMASAGVLLGILPTLLTMLGSNTAETSLLSIRRPFFAACLAAGSPAMPPIRAFEFYDPIDALKDRRKHVDIPELGTVSKRMIVLLEWLGAIGAVINVLELDVELDFRTVSSWASKETYLTLIWTVLVLVIHELGSISLRLRVKVRSRTENHAPATIRSRLAAWLHDEFTPCSEHSPTTLIWIKESYLFLFLSWCTSTLTILHITYGVLMFSSLLFISVQDAVSVVGRYFVSAMICRAIVAFELAGMRKASTVQDPVYPRGIDERYGLELSSVLAEPNVEVK